MIATEDEIVSQMESLAARLRSKVRPGHPDYISKADAATGIEAVLQQIIERFQKP